MKVDDAPAQSTTTPTPPEMLYRDMPLSEGMQVALEAAGYSAPTPIQAGMIPKALEGIDILGQARTGTGKTAAFVIPILERLKPRKEAHGPQALILVPTRELAVQVRGEVEKLAHGRRIHAVALYGGKPIKPQIDKLKKGVDVVVGTPGRVLDHLGRRSFEPRTLTVVVLDEADRMLDIGFRPDIERILKVCPQSRQTMLLSATVPPPIARLAQRYMRNPETLNFCTENMSVETIDQYYFPVSKEHKFDLLAKLLKRENPRQAIIFCRTKRGTEKVYRSLSKIFKETECIHGDLSQSRRDHVMESFRKGKTIFLVATDVVGRGIDVTNISHIVNYDIPEFADDYVHRVGRTGRMGREGVAYSFVSPEEGNELTRIEIRINRLLKRAELEGFHPDLPRTARASSGPPGGRGRGAPGRGRGHGVPPGENEQEALAGDGTAEDANKPAAQPQGLLSRKGRGPRRFRRAL